MASDDNLTGHLYTAAVLAALIGVVFAGARVYSNYVLLRRMHAEDWIIVVSTVSLIGGCVFVGLMAKAGYGRHLDVLTIQQRIDARFYQVLSVWPALLAIGLPKVAVAGLLCRLFSPGRWTRYFLWGVACLGVLNYTTVSFFSTFQCIPAQAYWDTRIQGARCVPWKLFTDYSWYIGAYSAAADFILACYPALVFRKMRFGIWKKMGLSFLMGLGVFATGVAILKVAHLGTLEDQDWTWDQTYLHIWSVVEAAVIISTACIPVLRPLYDQIVNGLRARMGGGRRGDEQAHHPNEGAGQLSPTQNNDERGGFWTRKMRLAMGSLGGAGNSSLWTSTTATAGTGVVLSSLSASNHQGEEELRCTSTGLAPIEEAHVVGEQNR